MYERSGKKIPWKNIEFVDISIDYKNDYEKWQNFVTERELGEI